MKILLVVDGSPYSVAATEMIVSLHLPISTKILLMTVVPEHVFLGGLTLKKLRGDSSEKAAQEQKAWKLLQQPERMLKDIFIDDYLSMRFHGSEAVHGPTHILALEL
jgi:hypothetical protein